MSSSSVSLRPVGEAVVPSATLVGSAPTTWQALSDNLDSTYIQNGLTTLQFLSPFGPNDVVVGVSLRYRLVRPGGVPAAATQYITLPGVGSIPWTLPGSAYQSVAGFVSSPTFTSFPGGHRIAPADFTNIIVQVNAAGTGAHILEVYLDVTYNTAPVVSALTPSGVVSFATPTFSWAYDDVEGDFEEEVDFLLFPSSVVTALGMSPTVPDISAGALAQAAFYGFGTSGVGGNTGAAIALAPAGSTSTLYQPLIRLTNGSYRVYVRVGDVAAWTRRSAWVSSDFTVKLPAPRMPSALVSGPYDALFGRVPVLVQGFDNVLASTVAGAVGSTPDFDLTNATALLDTTAARLWSDPAGTWTSTKSLRLTASSAANIAAKTHNASPVDVGGLVLAGAHVFSAVSRQAFATINWYDAGGGALTTVVGAQVPTAIGGAPTFVHAVGTAPASAQFARLTITIVSPANTEQHWIDDWIITPTAKGNIQDAHLWNGNLVSNTSFEAAWAGTALADWTTVTNGAGQTVAVVTETAVDGGHALQIQKNETTFAPPYAEWPDIAGGMPRVAVAAGDVFVVSGYFKRVLVGGVNGVFTIEAVYNDATHDQISVTPSPLTNHWESFVAAFQIPAGKTGVSFRFLPQTVGTTGAKGEIHLDLINISRASTRAVTAFHALGGGSGTPLGAGHGNSTVALLAFHLATPPRPYFQWQQGGLSVADTFTVERSVDGGATWTAVRAVPAPARDLTAKVYDYEAPPNALVMYRATTLSIDPVSTQPVSSAPSAPLLPDPGFESQLWVGSAGAPSSTFQPPDGSFVGAVDGTSLGELDSPFATIPAWAAQLGVRFLARALNTTATQASIVFYDQTQDSDNTDVFNDSPVVPIAASAGDTGWQRTTVAPFAVPPLGAFAQVQILVPAALDVTHAFLLAFDTFEVWPIDVDGRAAVVQTPRCLQWLKDPLNPGANLQVAVEVTNVTGSGSASAQGTESLSLEPQLVLQPSGRADQVVIADDVIGSETFPALQIVLRDDSEWRAFEALRRAQRTLLVQFPYGDLVGEQRYVRLGPTRTVGRIVSQDQASGQRRRVIIEAIEVAAP